MGELVGVIVKNGSTVERMPRKQVVRKDPIVDGVARLHFADGTTEEVRNAVGYYGHLDQVAD